MFLTVLSFKVVIHNLSLPDQPVPKRPLIQEIERKDGSKEPPTKKEK
jgi:hypothetical protein